MPVAARGERESEASAPARRGVTAFALMALGFVCARGLAGVEPLVFVAASLGLLVVALTTRGWACRVALALAMVGFGAGWIGVRTTTADPMTLWATKVDPHEGAVVTVEGLVASAPRVIGPATGEIVIDTPLVRRRTAAFELDARRAVGGASVREIRGRILVRVNAERGGKRLVSQGEFVRVTGVFRPVRGPLNPGEPDRRVWAAERVRVGTLDAASGELIESARAEPSRVDRLRSGLLRALGVVRARVATSLDAVAGPADADGGRSRTLLAVLLLGEREEGIEELEGEFARTGLVHVLAISGFHLAVLAWGVLWLVRFTGEREALEALAVGGVVVLYLLLVPAEAPVLRCGITVLVFTIVHASGRRYDRLNTLAWIAVGLLVWRPSDLWSPGFQLSFGVVAALLLCGDATTHRFFGSRIRAGSGIRAGAGIHPAARTPVGQLADAALRHAKSLVASSVLCWLVASPLVAYHAGWFSPLAAATGIVVVPLSALLLCVGYGAIVVGALSPTLGEWVGAPVRAMADWLAWLIAQLDQAAWSSVPVPLVSSWWAGCAALAVLMVFSWKTRPRWLVWARWGALVAAALWLAGELVWRGRIGSDVLLRIDTLAVGDGTCHVVRSRRPDAAWWERDDVLIWDAGSLRADIGLRELPRAIRCAGGGGVWWAPSVVVTHPNTDHYVAVPELVRPLRVRRVFMADGFVDAAEARPDSPAGQFVAILERRAVETRVLSRGDSFALGGATVNVLWPPRGRTFVEDNDGSLVARFEVQTAAGVGALLLTGDIGREAIGGLLAGSGEHASGVRADVLEAPHHGGFSELAGEFVVRVESGVVLQSTGIRRALDPRLGPLKASRAWYVTALDGAAWAEICADGTVRCGSLRRDREGTNRAARATSPSAP